MDINQWIEENKNEFITLSNKVWELAEPSFGEYESSRVQADFLEQHGFSVERGIAEIPTAFVASYGSGKPVIAILGEYDALPGLSQECVPHRKPIKENGYGHGCQHNLLGTAGIAAVMAIKEYMRENKIEGTIRYYGCPAEESGSGKTFMVKAGVFNDVDVALCWHPGDITGVWSVNVLAVYSVLFKFHGRAAHAAGSPFHGRSALDAVELMNVGANYLREHIIPDARLHYVITKGGEQPNVVPAEAEVWYYIRAPETSQVDEIYQRLINVAKGATMMTETSVDVVFLEGASNLLLNRTLEQLIHKKLQEIGPPKFDEKDLEFAREIRKTIPPQSLETMVPFLNKLGIPQEFIDSLKDKLLFDMVAPYKPGNVVLPGSTDVGDVSWVTPTAQFIVTTQALGTPGHSWQAVAQGRMSIGQKGMLQAAKVFAATAIELFQDKDLLNKVKQEFKEKISKRPYKSPIPDGTKPAIKPRPSKEQ